MRRQSTRGRGGLWPVLAVALILRLLPFFAAFPDVDRFYTPDARGYLALARDLRSGYLEPESSLWPIGLMRTPAYPAFAGLFLSLGGGSVLAVIAAQIGLSLVSIIVTYRLTETLLGPRPALLSAWVLCVDPATVVYTNLLQPESLFTALVLTSLFHWVRALRRGSLRESCLAGLLGGFATLARPIGLLMPIPILIVGAVSEGDRRRRLALSAAAILSFTAPVAGWISRNAFYTGVPLLSTIEGVNLLDYRAAGAVAMEDGRSLSEVRLALRRELNLRVQKAGNPAEESEAQSRFALEVLLQHPVGAIRSAGQGAFRLTAGSGLTALSGLRGDPMPEEITGFLENALSVLFISLLAAGYVAAALGALSLFRRREFLPLSLALGFILYFGLMSAGPEATTRFRVPLMPFVALLAGEGLSRLRFGGHHT